MFEYNNKSNPEYTDILIHNSDPEIKFYDLSDEEEKFAELAERSLVEFEEADKLMTSVMEALAEWEGDLDAADVWSSMSGFDFEAECEYNYDPNIELVRHTSEDLLDMDIESKFKDMNNYHNGCNLANATKMLKA